MECTFSVAQEPGDDASVALWAFHRDAAGNVSTTLDIGSTTETIAVEATCGELSAQVSVVAGAVAETPAAPPVSLLDTGAGTQAGGTPARLERSALLKIKMTVADGWL